MIRRPIWDYLTSHRENDAELSLAIHHARVSLLRSVEWIGLDHGSHTAQFSKVQCVLFSGWCSRSCAFYILRALCRNL